MVEEIFLKIILSLALGALIGIERERRGKGELVEGLRTFMLISLLGMLTVYFSIELLNSILPVFIAFIFVGLLTTVGYYVKTKGGKGKHIGMTTEIAFLVTFLIGLFVYFDAYPYFISVSLAILLTLILVSRESMHRFAKHVKEKEIWDAIIFAILTFIILPILPTKLVVLGVDLNPFVIWLSIVFVLSISFAGYILMKVLGTRVGLGLTGLFGGLASSTAVAVSMAEKSRANKRIVYSAAFATIIASSTMFFRVVALATIINTEVALLLILPLGILGVVGYLMSYFMWKKNSREQAKVEIGSPLALKSALQFGIFFTVILFFANLVRTYVGEIGIYLVSLFSGLVDLDAINISLSTLAISSITPAIAARGIILAALANTASKWFLTRWLGSRAMSNEVGKSFAVIITVGIVLLFILTLF
ncbi:MAG TPA: DUF4010 domain-containing protein [archaeon]|nr:DUF4010 domain-containing protein [archaeon]